MVKTKIDSDLEKFKDMSKPTLEPKKRNRLRFVGTTDFNALQPKNSETETTDFLKLKK